MLNKTLLQLMHLLKTQVWFFLCWEKAGPNSLLFGSATWRSRCCRARGDAKIWSVSRDFTSSKGVLQLRRLLLEAQEAPFLLRCNHRLVSAPPEQGRCSTQSFLCSERFFTSSTLFLGNNRELEAHLLNKFRLPLPLISVDPES